MVKKRLRLKILIVLIVFTFVFVLYQKKFTTRSSEESSMKPRLFQTDKLINYYRIHNMNKLKEKFSLKKISFNGYTAGGYGNKLYSFLTSLIISILTGSQLVLRWNHIDKYIDPPIQIFVDLSDDIGLNAVEFKNKSCHLSDKQAWNLNKNVDVLMKTSVPNECLRYFYNSINPLFMEICTNPEYFSKFLYYDLVTNETVKSAVKTLEHANSTEKEKQDKLFQVGFEVGGNLLNRVWRPNKKLAEQIDAYFDKEFKNHFVIGIQLRYGDGNPNQIYLDEKNDTIKFIDCALEIERNFTRQNSRLNTTGLFKWFIASDSETNIKNILTKYPGKAFTTEGNLSHVAYNSNGYQRTILDVELLSRCNETIITGGSTFGWISAMKQFKLPLYINGFSTMQTCVRAELSKLPKTPSGYGVF